MSPARTVRNLLAGLALLSFGRAALEQRELKRNVREIIGAGALETDDQLRKLHFAIRKGIDRHAVDRSARRPVLRSRAVDTWRSGRGLCGENARVAIAMLRLGGVRSNRLYLQGERWNHCMVEARWRDGWVAFDGHDDPKLAMATDEIGRIPSDRLDLFPNTAPRNPWRRQARFKQLFFIPSSRLDLVRPPSLVVRIAESPDLVRGVMATIAAAAVGALAPGEPT